MIDPTPEQLLETAVTAACAAGQHAMAHKDRRTETTETFSHDIKLVLDVECQEVAEAVILKEFPDHAILGEEQVTTNNEMDWEWIIDPIDGTMNYTYDFPYWCNSVAVRHKGTIVAGCVFAPEFDTCYTAHCDGPALRNGEPIHVGKTETLSQAMLFTGISKHMASPECSYFELFSQLALNTRKLRINGAAALDLCHVADGTTDAFFETSIYLWDHAAAGLIAERAGATLRTFPNHIEPHGVTVLCANAHLIDDIHTLFTTYYKAP